MCCVRAARSGGPYKVCCRNGSDNSRTASVSEPPPRRRGAGGQRALDDRAVPANRTSSNYAVGAATPGGPRCDDLRRWLNGITFHIPRRGGPMCPPVTRCVNGNGSDKTKNVGYRKQGSPGTATPTADNANRQNKRPHPARRCARAPLPERGALARRRRRKPFAAVALPARRGNFPVIFGACR